MDAAWQKAKYDALLAGALAILDRHNFGASAKLVEELDGRLNP